MFTKECPECGTEMIYKSKDALKNSIRKNSYCKSCMGKKISAKLSGVGKSQDHKNKLSAAKIGKNLSEDHKKKIGNSIRGLKRSDESKINYSLSKMGDKNPAKRADVRDKIRNSIINLYKEHPDLKDRISVSLLNYFENNPNYVNSEELSEYKIYRKAVDNLTKRNKKQLFDNWLGYDYYDGEFILNNIDLNYNDENYPTIDHKISILEGFKLKYLPEFISNINNLCITKRYLNTKKGHLDNIKFEEKLRDFPSIL